MTPDDKYRSQVRALLGVSIWYLILRVLWEGIEGLLLSVIASAQRVRTAAEQGVQEAPDARELIICGVRFSAWD
jgi:hypothetical protein